MPAHRIRTVLTGVAGSPYLSTVFLDDEVIINPSDAIDAVGDFWTALRPFLDNNMLATVQSEVLLFNNPREVASVSEGAAVAVQMSNVSNATPPATQGLIRWRTGTFSGNRRVQGRTFIPGVTEEQVTALGRPDGDFFTAMRTAGQALITAGLTVPSRRLNAFARATIASPWDQFAVLRSRRD